MFRRPARVSTRELLELIHDHQHTIIKELRAMSDNVDNRLTEQEAMQERIAAAITREIKQLADAVAGTGNKLNAAEIARFDAIGARWQSMADQLDADDGPTTPPAGNVDPAALASAIADARNAGATDVQLQAVVTLGSGVSPTITKRQLADAVAAAQVAAGDGSEAATAVQLASLIAVAV